MSKSPSRPPPGPPPSELSPVSSRPTACDHDQAGAEQSFLNFLDRMEANDLADPTLWGFATGNAQEFGVTFNFTGASDHKLNASKKLEGDGLHRCIIRVLKNPLDGGATGDCVAEASFDLLYTLPRPSRLEMREGLWKSYHAGGRRISISPEPKSFETCIPNADAKYAEVREWLKLWLVENDASPGTFSPQLKRIFLDGHSIRNTYRFWLEQKLSDAGFSYLAGPISNDIAKVRRHEAKPWSNYIHHFLFALLVLFVIAWYLI